MIAWNWTRESISPNDILDAAKTIPVTNSHVTMNLTLRWTSARRYLGWARAALDRGGEDGWDTASSLAKRAACRQMDGILAHNHLGCFQGHNYKKKSEYLAALKVPGLALLRELVIDPRNDIEHAYEVATEDQARRACDVTELFLGATDKEAEIQAIMALGWNISMREENCDAPGREYRILELTVEKWQQPMLLVSGYPDAPEVIVLIPQEETLRTCAVREFNPQQAIALNTRLRERLSTGSKNYSSRSFDEAFAKAIRDQLRL